MPSRQGRAGAFQSVDLRPDHSQAKARNTLPRRESRRAGRTVTNLRDRCARKSNIKQAQEPSELAGKAAGLLTSLRRAPPPGAGRRCCARGYGENEVAALLDIGAMTGFNPPEFIGRPSAT